MLEFVSNKQMKKLRMMRVVTRVKAVSQFFGHNAQIEIRADILETNSTPVVYFLALLAAKAALMA